MANKTLVMVRIGDFVAWKQNELVGLHSVAQSSSFLLHLCIVRLYLLNTFKRSVLIRWIYCILDSSSHSSPKEDEQLSFEVKSHDPIYGMSEIIIGPTENNQDIGNVEFCISDHSGQGVDGSLGVFWKPSHFIAHVVECASFPENVNPRKDIQ